MYSTLAPDAPTTSCFSEENFSTISFTYHLITHYHITACPFWDSFNLQIQIFSAARA